MRGIFCVYLIMAFSAVYRLISHGRRLKLPAAPAVSDSNHLLGAALRFDAIAVCVKNKIHAGVFITRRLIETAGLLLLLAAGCADGNNIPLTKTYFAKSHDDYLLHHLTRIHRN